MSEKMYNIMYWDFTQHHIVKFHDRGYSDILYGINSIDIIGYYTPEHSATKSHGSFHVLLPILCASIM